ncbi:DUF2185 domain-containing protein [Bremerella alba]|uniref:Uncharacterized protein n=1 Tax=Bremerella alba TaxID=980252 RepID=A0A7V9A778_9BACT|nr:DUF2185 domain-containing protein [Bremerella alba]MBA2115087.1 hypothetical protein [Bremerella alba]
MKPPHALNTAVIVCGHVAHEGLPILCALLGDPDDPDSEEDTSWQFLCDTGQDEAIEYAQVWALSNVLKREPTLRPWMNVPVGTRLVRESATAPWRIAED